MITITKRNIKRQKTTQNVPDGLDRRSTRDAAKKRSQHDKLHNITVLSARENSIYVYGREETEA